MRYQHQLEGVDRDWTTTDARTVALAGAAPGSYRFLVRAVFADGTATDPAAVEFTVLAPFWQRRWFLALAAVCTCALAFVVHRSRVRRAIAVERVRSQIAADLHDGVGASLSRIAILSEVVRQQAHSALPDAMPALTAISDNARAVIDDMSDAVWFIDPQVDNLQQVVIRARAMASELFDGQPIRWSVEAPTSASGVSLASEQRRHVYLIIKEALTNVLRHAQATNVVVLVTASKGRLRLEVTDDGIGLDGKASHGSPGPGGGHGLENMRRRASALGGTARIVSRAQGRGTTSSWMCQRRDRLFMRLATSDRDANMAPAGSPTDRPWGVSMTSGRRCKGTLLAWMCLSLIAPGAVRAERLPATIFTARDGIAPTVHRIVADSKGFIWFAGSEGLVRFDGNDFRVFTAADGLPVSSTSDILERRDGTYWVAAEEQLCAFDPRPNRQRFHCERPKLGDISTLLQTRKPCGAAPIPGSGVVRQTGTTPGNSSAGSNLARADVRLSIACSKTHAATCGQPLFQVCIDCVRMAAWIAGPRRRGLFVDQCTALSETAGAVWAGSATELMRFEIDPNTGEARIADRYGRPDGLPSGHTFSVRLWRGSVWAATLMGSRASCLPADGRPWTWTRA